MANWASTSYAVEGPREVLQRIKEAILEHPVTEGADEHYEGDILNALGIKWVSRNDDRNNGKYMRGFIRPDVEPWYDDNGALRFEAEEAWGATDFHEVLDENLPVKTYFVVVEEGEEIYATNDKEGKYFPDRFFVDVCIDECYNSEYFMFRSSVYKWLYDITNGRVKCEKELEKFNSDHEEAGDDDENYIIIHEFKVID